MSQKHLDALCIEYTDCQKCRYGHNVFFDKEPYRVFYRGNVDANVVLVGEGPGTDEIRLGKPFIGKAGKFLNSILEYAKIPQHDIFITNTFICSDDGYKKPDDDVMLACNNRLHTMLEIVQPKMVICLGMYAHRAVLGMSEKPPIKQHLGKMRMCAFKGSQRNLIAFTEYHPSYLLRSPSFKKEAAPRWKIIGETYHTLVTK